VFKKMTAITLCVGLAGSTITAPSRAAEDGITPGKIKHVLLISVDGLHALDLANYVNTHGDSTLTKLSSHGITYTNASTSTPSDSFPGLASLVTGGSPVTSGLWYDDTYNRKLSPPKMTDGLGNPGGNCPGTIGTNVAWDEAVDVDLTRLDGGGGLNQNFLVRDPNNGCKRILPHQYLRVNTIFEVVRANGGRTAWTQWQGSRRFFRPRNQLHSSTSAIPGLHPSAFPGSHPG
jgi:hypothetical protein